MRHSELLFSMTEVNITLQQSSFNTSPVVLCVLLLLGKMKREKIVNIISSGPILAKHQHVRIVIVRMLWAC